VTRSVVVFFFVWSICASLAVKATAEERGCAEFVAAACSASEFERLRQAIALELQSQDIELVGAGQTCATGSAPATRNVELELSGSCTLIEPIQVRAVAGETRRERTLALAEIPEKTRARVVALVLSELAELALHPDWEEPAPSTGTLPSTEETAPSEAEPRETTRPAAGATTENSPSAKNAEGESANVTQGKAAEKNANAETRRPPGDATHSETKRDRVELRLAAEARAFFPFNALAGVRGSVGFGVVTLGASVLGNQRSADIGDVNGLLLEAVLGVRFARASLGETWFFESGVRLGGGLVSVSGSPDAGTRAQDFREPYVDGALGAGVFHALGPEVSVGLNLETGYARGIVALADSEHAAAYGGLFVGGLLNLSLSL
jgi:hypothetical protein